VSSQNSSLNLPPTNTAVPLVTPCGTVMLACNKSDLPSFVVDAVRGRVVETENLVAIPPRADLIRIMRGMGMFIPERLPITKDDRLTLSKGMDLFESQRVTSEVLIANPRAFVLSEMGTAKTLSVLRAVDWLHKQGIIRKVLVIAPISTMRSVWEHEVFMRYPHLTVKVAHHPVSARRVAILKEDADIYVINPDAVKVKSVIDHLSECSDIDVVIIDELSDSFRNAGTVRWRTANKLINASRMQPAYVWGVTGSPIPKAASDAYAQIKLIRPDAGLTSFSRFRSETMVQINDVTWVNREDALDRVLEVMKPAVRYTREQVVELPPTTYIRERVTVSARAAEAYKSMSKHLVMDHSEGTITAANAGVAFNKLLQLACGLVYDDAGVPIDFDSGARVERVRTIIESNSHKTIVFVPFKSILPVLAKMADANGIPYAVVDGSVSERKRADIFSTFQQADAPRVIFAHPKCMSHGVTLTRATTIVWYAPTVSLETYMQANARIVRPSQKHKTQIVELSATPVEERIYKTLEDRQDFQSKLLEKIRELTNDF